MQFFLLDESKDKYKFVNLFLRGGNDDQGKIYLEINQSLISEHYLNLKSDYTNVYLPYTKEVTIKYSIRLYEYLRSYLYMNAQNPEIEKLPTKKEYKKYVNKSKLIANYFKNKKNKII